jgi:hypothetical protein
MSVDVVARFSKFATDFPIFGNGYVSGSARDRNAARAGKPSTSFSDKDNNPYTPFAKGGRFMSGQNALVGEEGPELVTFGAAGSVLPAGPTAQLMQPTSSLGNDKGQAELLAALRDLAAAQAQASGDTIEVYETTSARQTAEEILRVKQANRFLAGRA